MIILKTRSEVKVTVTWKWYATLRHPKMHPHIKFGIPTSKNVEDMRDGRTDRRTDNVITIKLSQRSRSWSQWPENDMRHSAIPRCIHTPNLESYLKEYIGDMHQTQSGMDGRTVRLLYASQSSFGGIKNFLRIMSKSHAYLQTMTKTLVKFRKNQYRTVGRVAHIRYPLPIHIVIAIPQKRAKFNLRKKWQKIIWGLYPNRPWPKDQ